MPIFNSRLLVARGIISILFGFLALSWPGPGLFAIALLFGAYAFVDGVAAIGTVSRRGGRGWVLPVIEGVAGIGAGIVTVVWPGITIMVLSMLMGVWALVTGLLEVIASLSFSDVLARPSTGTRVLLAIAGLLSIALGAFIFTSPALGAVVLLTYVAVYAIFFGIVLATLGIRLGRGPVDELLEQERRSGRDRRAA